MMPFCFCCPGGSSKSCAEDEFQCNNMVCIPAAHKCNGHRDCHNGEDEDEYHCRM